MTIADHISLALLLFALATVYSHTFDHDHLHPYLTCFYCAFAVFFWLAALLFACAAVASTVWAVIVCFS